MRSPARWSRAARQRAGLLRPEPGAAANRGSARPARRGPGRPLRGHRRGRFGAGEPPACGAEEVEQGGIRSGFWLLALSPGACAVSRERSEPRARFSPLGGPVGVPPLPGPRAIKLALGPCQRHVQQAPLLGQGRTVGGVGNRHEARFQPADPNRRPLEALGAMEAADGHGARRAAPGSRSSSGSSIVVSGCDRAERDTGAPQDLTDHSDLGVGPCQHRHLLPGDAPANDASRS